TNQGTMSSSEQVREYSTLFHTAGRNLIAFSFLTEPVISFKRLPAPTTTTTTTLPTNRRSWLALAVSVSDRRRGVPIEQGEQTMHKDEDTMKKAAKLAAYEWRQFCWATSIVNGPKPKPEAICVFRGAVEVFLLHA